MTGCAAPLDTRADTELLALNQRATSMIPEFFKGLQIEQQGGVPSRCEEMWVAYFAAEMFGNADAAIITIVHNRGRQARILERQMYEVLKKAEYYVAHADEARLELLAAPWRDKEFAEQMHWDQSSIRYASILKAIEVVSQRFPEVPQYARQHRREKTFREMVGDQHDTNAAQEYAFNYRRLSQTAHVAAAGMEDVFAYRADGNMDVKFDSRLPDPDFAIQNMTLYLIAFLDLANRLYGLGRELEIDELAAWSDRVMARLRPEEHQAVKSGGYDLLSSTGKPMSSKTTG
jgi:hypothetical protein